MEMEKAKIVIPRIVVRPLLPPSPDLRVRLQPQHLHWQVGRYEEVFSIGPGGVGKKRVWKVDQEGEQHNLILDQTYDVLIAAYGFFDLVRYSAVGTGSTLPDVTQTALANEVANTNAVATGYPAHPDLIRVSDGVTDIQSAREFTEAQVGGQNLTEWGFGPAVVGSPSRLVAAVRELFRDGNGNPITLTLAADQRLRLIYKMRLTMGAGAPTPVPVSININGIGVRTGNMVMRKKNVGANLPSPIKENWDAYMADLFAKAKVGDYMNNVIHVAPGVDPGTYYHSTSSYTNNLKKAIAYQEYSAGSRQRLSQPVIWLSSEANVTIYGFGIGDDWNPSPVVLFDPGQEFTKDNLHKLQIDAWTLTWGP